MKTIGFIITEVDIEGYANISGDYNPVHLDSNYARDHGYQDKIAHGMLSMGKVWSVLSCHLLTDSAWPEKYELKFLAPVFVGDIVTLNVEKNDEMILLNGLCSGKPILKGKIMLKK
ncbi:MaoC/PaaZ C-terminal domain-containing protein [Bacillus sp. T3]|uniref:MaoC/PaaZ C-terminal domain-containing protein n=1 Tax=Bacillus sp. T3 TaxID=467262 RepID=UPI0029818B71|nr:MaoC/PaaZ C-terminal domain-containing protein [Bacillus sp. T3]